MKTGGQYSSGCSGYFDRNCTTKNITEQPQKCTFLFWREYKVLLPSSGVIMSKFCADPLSKALVKYNIERKYSFLVFSMFWLE